MPYSCSICEQASTSICVACTKDTCDDHLCLICKSCSDCCQHEVRLDHRADTRPTVRQTLQQAGDPGGMPRGFVPL
jgi:hypothetical protein